MGGKLLHTILIAAASIVIMLAPAYSGTLQQYSDSAVFAGLTEGMTLLNFDNQVNSGGYTWDNSSAGFNVGGVQFVPIPFNSFSTSFAWQPNTQIDWGTKAVLQTAGASDGHLHIVLPGAGSTAIGLNLMSWASSTPSGYHSGATYTINVSSGDPTAPVTTAAWTSSMGSSPRAAGISPTWFGLTSDTPITYLDLYSSEGAIIVDNFQFGTATAQDPPPDVPEASTMILIGTGLASLRFLRKFSPRHAV